MKNPPYKRYNHIPLSKDFNNWWYIGRKILLKHIITVAISKKDLSILEIGPGTGVNIEVLQNYGKVDLLEVDNYFIQLIENNTLLKINEIFDDFSKIKRKYDVIVFLDVLEHIDNYDSFLNNVRQILKSDGIAIMSVPAYQALFSKHDEELHHFRRYNWNMIQEQIKNKFVLKKRFGYNYILLPIRFIQIKLIKKPKSDTTVNSVLNLAFKLIIFLEVFFLKIGLNPKFGLSLFAILKK